MKRLIFQFLIIAVAISGCSLPKYATIRSQQPPDYYLGASPAVGIIAVEGSARTLEDAVVRALRNQSLHGGHFTIEDRLNEGIRFDTRSGRLVMTGKDVPVTENDVYIKATVIDGLKQDGRTIITRGRGREAKRIPVIVTVMPVAFTVARGNDILMNEFTYDGRSMWRVSQGYPDRYGRYEAAIANAVQQFLADVTPRTVTRRVRLDYSDKAQKPILDAARNGQVKQAATELRDYAAQHQNSASATYNLAVLTDALGDYEKAIEYYDRALSLGGKDYYMQAKTSCMQRLSQQRALEESHRATEPAPLPDDDVSEDTAGSNERPGDGGNDVEWVQQTLNALGYDCGIVDGIMGGNTRSCIRAFQEANDLDITGSVNEATYQKILEVR